MNLPHERWLWQGWVGTDCTRYKVRQGLRVSSVEVTHGQAHAILGWLGRDEESKALFQGCLSEESGEKTRTQEHVHYPREEGRPGLAPEEAGGSLAEVVAFSSTKRTEEQVGNTIAENAKQGAWSHGLKVGSPVSNLSIPWELVRGLGSWGRQLCFDPLYQVVLMQLGPEAPAEIGDLELEMHSLALSSPDKQVPRGVRMLARGWRGIEE